MSTGRAAARVGPPSRGERWVRVSGVMWGRQVDDGSSGQRACVCVVVGINNRMNRLNVCTDVGHADAHTSTRAHGASVSRRRAGGEEEDAAHIKTASVQGHRLMSGSS